MLTKKRKKHDGTVYSKPINTKEVAQLFQNSVEKALELEIKKIEQEINQPLTNELKKMVSDFIQARKKMTRDQKDEEAEDKAWELEDRLKEKGLSDENIEEIIKYCERLVKLDQQLETEKLQANIEISTNK